jgi:hypothetical protein
LLLCAAFSLSSYLYWDSFLAAGFRGAKTDDSTQATALPGDHVPGAGRRHLLAMDWCAVSDEFYGFYDPDFDEQDEDDGEFDFDCGAMYGMKGEPLGCGKVGSEECDFECPYREEVERSLRASYAANQRWAKAEAKKKK